MPGKLSQALRLFQLLFADGGKFAPALDVPSMLVVLRYMATNGVSLVAPDDHGITALAYAQSRADADPAFVPVYNEVKTLTMAEFRRCNKPGATVRSPDAADLSKAAACLKEATQIIQHYFFTTSGCCWTCKKTARELALARNGGDRAKEEQYRKKYKKQLLCCGMCQSAFYCSEQCQNADWPEHKLECRQLSTLGRVDRSL